MSQHAHGEAVGPSSIQDNLGVRRIGERHPG